MTMTPLLLLSFLVAHVRPALAFESSRQSAAVSIALSYQASNFEPPWFATDPHVQTLSGALFRNVGTGFSGGDRLAVPGIDVQPAAGQVSRVPFWDRRVRIETPDGDFYDVDYKYCGENIPVGKNGKALVVMTHGLESSSLSPLNVDAARAFISRGVDVACINFRGCSGEPNRLWKMYHLGFTDDVLHFLARLSDQQEFGSRPIYLCGFSLGANVVLKALGELGSDATSKFNVRGAAVSCVPFDCVLNRAELGRPGINKEVYSSNLLRQLKGKIQQKVDCIDGPPPFDNARVQAAKTINEFDDEYVAPVYGFDGYLDYYNKSSSIHYLDGIAVPTMVLNALDDPLFDPSTYPAEVDTRPIRMVYTNHGGHLGYMYHRPKRLHSPSSNSATFMPNELASFVDHVHSEVVV